MDAKKAAFLQKHGKKIHGKKLGLLINRFFGGLFSYDARQIEAKQKILICHVRKSSKLLKDSCNSYCFLYLNS